MAKIKFDDSERVSAPRPATTAEGIPEDVNLAGAENLGTAPVPPPAAPAAKKIKFNETERLKPGRPGIPSFPAQIKDRDEAEAAAQTGALRKEYADKYGDDGLVFPGSETTAAIIQGAGEGALGPEGAAVLTGAVSPGGADKVRLKQEILAREHPLATAAGRVAGGTAGFLRNTGMKAASLLGQAFRGAVVGATPGVLARDPGQAAAGAALGGGFGAASAIPVPRGVNPETLSRLGGFAQNTLKPAAATVARNSPYAFGVGMGAKQAYEDPTAAGQAQGVMTALLPVGAAAFSAFGRGGAHTITPAREQAESVLSEAARKWALEQGQKLREGHRADVADLGERARAVHDAAAARQAEAQAQRKASEDAAYKAHDTIEQTFEQQAAAREEAIAQARRVNEEATAAEARERGHGVELTEAQKAQKADYDAKAEVQRAFMDKQRREYIDRMKAQARAEAESAFGEALASFESQKAQAKATKAAGKKGADGKLVTPRAQAEGEGGQVYGKAGTRLSHMLDAIERGVVPEDPELRGLYQHVVSTLGKNNPRELAKLREIIEAGGYEPWVEKRAAAIAAERAKAAAEGTPADTTTPAAMPGPVRPRRAEFAPPAGIARDADVESQVFSREIAGGPAPHEAPNPVDPTTLPRKPFAQHMKDAGADLLPPVPTAPSRTKIAEEWSGIVPDMRAAPPVRRFSDYLDESALPEDFTTPPPEGAALDALMAEQARAFREQATREAPRKVRDRMTFPGRVPEGRSVVRQYDLENPRFHAADLFRTAQGRRLATDAVKDAEPYRHSPIESLLNKNTPAEAAYILKQVEDSRGRVDARRAGARRVVGGAAVGSSNNAKRSRPGGGAPTASLPDDPAFLDFVKKKVGGAPAVGGVLVNPAVGEKVRDTAAQAAEWLADPKRREQLEALYRQHKIAMGMGTVVVP